MATAQDISGLTGIRQDLLSRGITNDRIGYNKGTGMVTIDGQDFIKPATVNAGVSYADPTAYKNAYDVYNTGQAAKSAQDDFLSAIKTPAANPYDTQVANTLSQLMQRLNNPTPYDVYSSPEYAAQQAATQRAAGKSVRGAQESLGAAGLGRSSVLADRAQGIQNDANEYMQLQVVPQLTAAHQAQEQQALANLGTLLSALSGQQGVYDQRAATQQDALGKLLDFTTGRADRAAETQYRTVRDAIEDMRYDEQVTYQKERDQIADEKDKRDFDEDVRRFGLNFALQQQAEKRMAASAAASAASARRSDDLARERFEYEKTRDKKADEAAAAKAAGGLSAADMQKEASSMLSALRSGQITPQAALEQINDDVSLGIYSRENADYLRSQITRVAPDVPKTTATPEQVKAASASMPSDKEIEAEARAKGYAILDYKSWYKSSDGRLAGLDYQTWKSLYGPRMSPRR